MTKRCFDAGFQVPCHRIIGADGSLTGFGTGLDTKAVLLDLERDDNQFELF